MKAKKNLAPDPKFNWWVLYFFTFFYVAVEFGFNYQMLDLTVDFESEDISTLSDLMDQERIDVENRMRSFQLGEATGVPSGSKKAVL